MLGLGAGGGGWGDRLAEGQLLTLDQSSWKNLLEIPAEAWQPGPEVRSREMETGVPRGWGWGLGAGACGCTGAGVCPGADAGGRRCGTEG